MSGDVKLAVGHLGSLGLVVGLLAGGSVAWAGNGDVKQRIESRLDKKLGQGANIEVTVEQGRAVLTGVTTTVYDKNRAERAARKEAEDVDNQIRVFPDGEYHDAEIVKGVRKAVLGYAYYSIFDGVAFAVEDGAVWLTGSVYQPWRKEAIEKRISRVEGIRELHSDIEVQPVSFFDERIRRELAYRIYSDARFVQYAHRANPPIKILVDKGKVTLAGSVASPVEQVLLGHIARGVLSFGVENQIQVDGESPEETPGPVSVS
jgi:osmotically-inducible protein OsmY